MNTKKMNKLINHYINSAVFILSTPHSSFISIYFCHSAAAYAYTVLEINLGEDLMMKQSKNSLFSQQHPAHHEKKNDENNCDGCICELFRRLNEECTDVCTANNQFFYILPKGVNRPIGDTTPIAFRFLRFDPKSCCTFFEITIEQNTITLQVAIDCHEISGIVPIQ